MLRAEADVFREMHVGFFTKWVFVEVCDVYTLIWADSLGTDAVSYYIFLNMNNTKGPITSPLPVNLIIVHLETQQES